MNRTSWLSIFSSLIVCAGIALGGVAQDVSRPSLKAIASGEVEPPLVIEEKDLRKLNELVRTRMTERAETHRIQYTITFATGFYYETEDLDPIFQEENASSRRIERLMLTARVVPRLTLSDQISLEEQHEFEQALLEIQRKENPRIEIVIANDGASYSISGADRDWVLNTQVDLSERLQSFGGDGAWIRKFSGIPFAILSFLAAFAIPASRFRARYDARLEALDADHAGTPLLRYVFFTNDEEISSLRVMITSQTAMAIGVATFFVVQWLAAYLYPDMLLLIGEELERHKNLVDMRKYIATGVILTFVLSVSASVVANLITKRDHRFSHRSGIRRNTADFRSEQAESRSSDPSAPRNDHADSAGRNEHQPEE